MIKLNDREKRIVGAGGGFLLLFLLYTLLISPAMSKYEGMGRKIEQKSKELQEIEELRTEYQDGKKQLEKFEGVAKGDSFSLFSFLESLADKEDIRDHIASMKPKNVPLNEKYNESSVEIKVDKIQYVEYQTDRRPDGVMSSGGITTQRGGFFTSLVEVTDKVKKGQVVGLVKNFFGEVVEEIKSPIDGLVLSRYTEAPHIGSGQWRVFAIAAPTEYR